MKVYRQRTTVLEAHYSFNVKKIRTLFGLDTCMYRHNLVRRLGQGAILAGMLMLAFRRNVSMVLRISHGGCIKASEQVGKLHVLNM